jgi:hypothetical protein
MAYPLALNKGQLQGSPYYYVWQTAGAKTRVGKYIGTSMIWFEGVDDTACLRKINAHEAERSALGKTSH